VIHFIIATVSEAKPLINFYSLKKKKTAIFTFYSNDQISLTISGIGKINAAMSVTQTFYEFNHQKNNIWINFGIAGHKNEKIGNIFLIDKIVDNETQKKNILSYWIIVGLNKNLVLPITNLTTVILMIYQIWRLVVFFLDAKNIRLKNLFIQLKLFLTMKKKE
tara:strand:- start:60 stop:548 length:489 start_codon:yes stop_codon:yes gene_type:complete